VGVPTFEVSPPVLRTKLQQQQVTPPQVRRPATEQLRDALQQLSISPTGGQQPGVRPLPADSPGKGAPPELGARSKVSDVVPEAGPSLQRTRQMEKELTKNLLQQLKEAEKQEKK
jgi:hypothetical protein